METTMTEVVRTTDLALATTLRVNGFLPDRMEVNDARNGVWVYEPCDGLAELVKDYHDGLVEVEPRDYNRSLGRTRGELFDFLREQGVKPARSAG